MKKLLFLCFSFLIMCGCNEEKNNNPENVALNKPINSCEGCHTNYNVLKSIASPDTAVAGGGCGGDVPHIEVYDRVFMGGEGFTKFKNTMHGKLECTVCHNGVNNTDDKNLAHSNNFIKHPSHVPEEKCVKCHGNVVQKFQNSLHQQGWGQKKNVFRRAGLNSFDELSHSMKDGYDHNCGKCHANCGDCHVNRPVQGGGGLFNGHQFSKPDMREHCTTCHVSRGGHAYFGVGAGTIPDVHLTKAGFECISCHNKNELHGDSRTYEHRYQMQLLPKCENCHSGVVNSNAFHVQHINDMNCNTCHSQDYNNCGSCHVGGEGARVAAYQGFKIGMNHISADKPYKYATLRRSMTAPDSWKEYGISNLNNFDVLPTYKYATPHNIIRWTARTKVSSGKPCYDACHIIKEGSNYRNKELYLFESNLENWEKSADKNIVVDGKLPSRWN